MPREKDLEIGLLLDFYGEMLSPEKREAVRLYYDEDLSLAEIAGDTDITRQGVRDRMRRRRSSSCSSRIRSGSRRSRGRSTTGLRV